MYGPFFRYSCAALLLVVGFGWVMSNAQENGQRPLARGVMTVIPPAVEKLETVTGPIPIVELVSGMPDLDWTPHYDPKMVLQFVHHEDDYDLWEAYDAVDAPTLCLRGEASDLLLADTAEDMRRRGPRAAVVTIAGCGHAPALNVPEQIGLIERFLRGDQA